MTDQKPPRVYAPGATELGRAVALDRDETVHLLRVLRLESGSRILTFDGKGHEFLAELSVSGTRAMATPLFATHPAVEPASRVVVAQALLKGQKMDDVIRDTVMLGASAVQPLLTARTERLHAGREPGRRLDRWRRIASASAAQSGRAVVPEIGRPVQFADFVAKTLCGTGMMLVEPASGDPGAPEASGNGPRVVTLLVGPEGGWTPEEISAAVRAGYRTWTLGERTLRADAAALVGLAVLLARLGDL